MNEQKTKVAILGGGCGGMSVAFWLTSTKDLRSRFEVTVYTRGWRLGGKGASGRNAAHSDRIEEHGLHMWMGCYENAFRTIRACFDAWHPPANNPFQTWTDAFTPQVRVSFMQRDGGPGGNQDVPWNFVLPRRAGTPGDGAPLAWADRLFRVANWLSARMRLTPAGGKLPSIAARLACLWRRTTAYLVLIIIWCVTRVLIALRLAVAVTIRILRGIRRLRPIAKWPILFDLGLTMVIGIARDILPFGIEGFDRLNLLDFRAWLASHGAMNVTTDSPTVCALYDLGFAYPNGDSTSLANGKGAAGAALRFLIELALGYKGAPLWKMNAGMGDTIFTPLFEVLRSRGVNFKFFHEVAHLAISEDSKCVSTIVLNRQVNLRSKIYNPLVECRGLSCWPSEPLWDQLIGYPAPSRDGADFESIWNSPKVGEVRLNVGTDFDVAVLAIPPDMARIIGPALSEHSAVWQRMIDNSSSVITQAFQLWLAPTTIQLGWNAGPAVLSANASPFGTWADMTHLLPRENWSGQNVPQSIAYFCGVMKMTNIPVANPIGFGDRDVKRDAEAWMKRNASGIWPAKMHKGVAPGPGLIVEAYFRCNVDPSERYVQTLPGSVNHRLAPDSLPFKNLYLAGDWTLTRYSSGCVEAAVESGMLASRAICGAPSRIYGH